MYVIEGYCDAFSEVIRLYYPILCRKRQLVLFWLCLSGVFLWVKRLGSVKFALNSVLQCIGRCTYKLKINALLSIVNTSSIYFNIIGEIVTTWKIQVRFNRTNSK